jgi:hypothetical protein
MGLTNNSFAVYSNTGEQGYSARACTPKQIKSQRRQDRWRTVAQNAKLKLKYRTFLRGCKDFWETCNVNHEDIERAMHRCPCEWDDYFYRGDHTPIEGKRMSQAWDVEIREMQRTLELLEDGGVGFLPETKKQGWIRIMLENWNSLGVFTHTWKVDRLRYLIKHLDIDLLVGCEVQCDCTFIDQSAWFPDLLFQAQAIKGLASHNTTDRIQREQMEDIVVAIAKWRQDGEEVILVIDANQDVYNSKLCQMLCLFEPVLGECIPNSHFWGRIAISTMFGSPGLVSNNAICFSYWYGIGDHRVFVIEVSTASLFGGEFPTITTPMVRSLNCKIL